MQSLIYLHRDIYNRYLNAMERNIDIYPPLTGTGKRTIHDDKLSLISDWKKLILKLLHVMFILMTNIVEWWSTL